MSDKELKTYMKVQCRFMSRVCRRLHITHERWVELYAVKFRNRYNRKELLWKNI